MLWLVKKALGKVYLDDFVRDVLTSIRHAKRRVYWNLKRDFARLDKKIVAQYMYENSVKKLHIGCGDNMLPGWLNADMSPYLKNVFRLDATQIFPFGDEKFDYIFSEHMIEHISYQEGFFMLCKCYRILKIDGKIRVSTPNLAFLADLYSIKKSELQLQYTEWATKEYIKNAPYPDDTFVINNFMRAWGHLFIYDEKTLRSALERAGFTEIVKCNLNESQDEALRNLENENRLPNGFLRLETFTLEGIKK